MDRNEIPISLKPFFQEYTFENLDAAQHADLVIERTLAWGNRVELRWLFERYGQARIAEWFKQMGTRRLPKRHLPFWSCILDVRLEDLSVAPRGAWQY
ncbi:MAG: hypothetical protein HY327_02940 [Chloroflexi bacterium]|nr:hypothetical protein [Chloroflexota bacterium]